MNNNLAVSDGDAWVVDRYSPEGRGKPLPGLTPEGPSLDFGALIRIISNWRWFIVGAIALGLVGAIVVTLLTTPLYRSRVTLEVNPPTVEIMDEQTRDHSTSGVSSWDFVATQVGLLSSRSIAERAAHNKSFVCEEGDAASRLNAATSKVAAGLNVDAPDVGQLIKFSFDAESPQLSAAIANQVADSFINSSLQRRYEATAYARNFLERQIAKTRADLEKSERQQVAYAQAQGIINTSVGEDGRPT